MLGTRLVLCAVALSAGCADLLGIDTSVVIEEPGADCAEWTPQHFDPCAIPAARGSLVLTSAGTYVLNTGSGVVSDPSGRPMEAVPSIVLDQGADGHVRLLAVENLEIPRQATLRATGPLPLLIAATSSVRIDGVLDASSTKVSNGPGAAAAPCDTNQLHGQFIDGLDFASGAGGGGFGGDGGAGGLAMLNSPIVGGQGGRALLAPPHGVRAGCRGGSSVLDNAVSVGGLGGGAVQLSARVGISIGATARLHAGGQGGQGGTFGLGGGGAGFVTIHADALDVAATAAFSPAPTITRP
jgi:hypothetical protein